MNDNTIQGYHVLWNFRHRGRRLSLDLQRRISITIVALAGNFPINVECLLHNGIQGIHEQVVIPVPTANGLKLLVIREDYVLLFRLVDLRPYFRQRYGTG